jgi:hypothetical protein
MLPKSARLFLFGAVLACANAKGAPGPSSPAAHGPRTCKGGRITTAADAAAFAGCRAVSGDLTIEGTDLSDLSALSALHTVSGALTIRHNARLRDLGGLEHVERVGSLELTANGLFGTRGIEGLRQVETLVIASNRLLISLGGFRNLERVDTLIINHNPRIAAQLGLFPALSRVEHGLAVRSNLGLSRDDVEQLLARTRGWRS